MLRIHKRGGGDPTYRIDGDRHWRGIRTPEGPTTCWSSPRPATGGARRGLGPRRRLALAALPAMLGADDDVSGFDPDRHPLVAEAWRRYDHLRIGRTGLVMRR